MDKPTFKGFLLGATALAVTSMPAVAGQDQDQVIQDLQQQLQALQSEVQTLKSQTDAVQSSNREMYKNIRRVEQGANPPKMVSSGQKKFSLAISGHVNRVIMWADNGNNSDVFYSDNNNASTRWRFIGKGKVNEDVSIGSRIEVQLESNSSGAVSVDDVAGNGDSAGSGTFGERYADLNVTSKSMGSVYLGQGDPFSNGIAEYDVSGTSAIAYSLWAALGGGMSFVNSATNARTGPTVGTVFENMDGRSRDDRIRYNTPSFAGFSAGISSISGGAMDVALKYSGKVAGTVVKAGIAYLDESGIGNDDDQISGSVSARHSSGFGVTVAAGKQENDTANRDEELLFLKASYMGKWFNLGSTSLSIQYASYDDATANGDEYEGYGGSVVQEIAGMGASFFADVRVHTFDDSTAVDWDDIWVVTGGARFKF